MLPLHHPPPQKKKSLTVSEETEISPREKPNSYVASWCKSKCEKNWYTG